MVPLSGAEPRLGTAGTSQSLCVEQQQPGGSSCDPCAGSVSHKPVSASPRAGR